MTKILSAIATFTIAFAPAIASAEPSEPIAFKHAGINYIYTTEQVGNTKILRGEAGSNREPFVLRVGKHMVTGTVNGSEVAFSRNSVKHIQGIVIIDQLAAR